MLKSVFTILPLLLLPLLLENAWAQTASPAPQSSPLPPLIILIGPPLSGKTTLVDSITKTYNVPNISVEDLIKDNAAELEHLRAQGMSMAEMRYDPAMSRYVRERLKSADLSHGIAFDGYPATLVQAEDLSKMVPDLKLKPIAFQLQVPDDVIRERSKTTGRQSDNPQILEQRIKNYHREMDAISLLRWMGQGSSACESSRSVYLLSIFVKRRRTGYRSSWHTKSARRALSIHVATRLTWSQIYDVIEFLGGERAIVKKK